VSPRCGKRPSRHDGQGPGFVERGQPRENHQEAFNTELVGRAVDELRLAGFEVSDDDVAHLGPTMTEHLNVHGRYHFDLSATPKALRQLSVHSQSTAQ
jgi:hypothetical protein